MIRWLLAIAVLAAVGFLWRKWHASDEQARLRRAEEKEKRRLRTQAMFTELARCLARHEIDFKFVLDRGEYSGQTIPGPSGGYISFRQFFGDYMVELHQADIGDGAVSFDQQARADIHGVIAKIILKDCPYFFRQRHESLEKAGMEEVVSVYAFALAQYQRVWYTVEAYHIRKKLISLEQDKVEELGRVPGIAEISLSDEKIRK